MWQKRYDRTQTCVFLTFSLGRPVQLLLLDPTQTDLQCAISGAPWDRSSSLEKVPKEIVGFAQAPGDAEQLSGSAAKLFLCP